MSLRLWHNYRCVVTGRQARDLHSYVAARFEAVTALQTSTAWVAHFDAHDQRDALWRHRRISAARPSTEAVQILALLVWAWLLYPHCDALLFLGTLVSALQVTGRVAFEAVRCWRRRSMNSECFTSDRQSSVKEPASPDRPPIAKHSESLPGPPNDRNRSRVDTPPRRRSCTGPGLLLEESPGEIELRRRIETMRMQQETIASWNWAFD